MSLRNSFVSPNRRWWTPVFCTPAVPHCFGKLRAKLLTVAKRKCLRTATRKRWLRTGRPCTILQGGFGLMWDLCTGTTIRSSARACTVTVLPPGRSSAVVPVLVKMANEKLRAIQRRKSSRTQRKTDFACSALPANCREPASL